MASSGGKGGGGSGGKSGGSGGSGGKGGGGKSGGEQAASTLWTVRQQARGEDAESETPAASAFKGPIRDQFEREGSPYYASARLWDDGILDPLDSRAALGLALTATAGSLLPETRTGVYRM